mmetsp:Transcript_19639/g.29307  ORF Transcript_19639/g.29307 Transcript_19639/m.29307 type:complete len:247 (-) Transcript_19639:67-807(-)
MHLEELEIVEVPSGRIVINCRALFCQPSQHSSSKLDKFTNHSCHKDNGLKFVQFPRTEGRGRHDEKENNKDGQNSKPQIKPNLEIPEQGALEERVMLPLMESVQTFELMLHQRRAHVRQKIGAVRSEQRLDRNLRVRHGPWVSVASTDCEERHYDQLSKKENPALWIGRLVEDIMPRAILAFIDLPCNENFLLFRECERKAAAQPEVTSRTLHWWTPHAIQFDCLVSVLEHTIIFLAFYLLFIGET